MKFRTKSRVTLLKIQLVNSYVCVGIESKPSAYKSPCTLCSPGNSRYKRDTA